MLQNPTGPEAELTLSSVKWLDEKKSELLDERL